VRFDTVKDRHTWT